MKLVTIVGVRGIAVVKLQNNLAVTVLIVIFTFDVADALLGDGVV